MTKSFKEFFGKPPQLYVRLIFGAIIIAPLVVLIVLAIS